MTDKEYLSTGLAGKKLGMSRQSVDYFIEKGVFGQPIKLKTPGKDYRGLEHEAVIKFKKTKKVIKRKK